MTNTLRVRRAEREISQMDVAKQLGMSFNRYWRIENGHTEPTDAEREAFATFFGVKESALFPRASRRKASVEVSA